MSLMARPRRKLAPAQPVARSKPRAPRRWILPVIVIAIVTCAAAALLLLPLSRPRGAVILISIDTLRADHLPLYGYAKGRTPTIDAIAKDAVVFDRAYAH